MEDHPRIPRRHKTPEQKVELVLLALSGKSPAEISREQDIALSVLYRWRAGFITAGTEGLASVAERELSERTEIAQLRTEVEQLERLLGRQTAELASLRSLGGLA